MNETGILVQAITAAQEIIAAQEIANGISQPSLISEKLIANIINKHFSEIAKDNISMRETLDILSDKDMLEQIIQSFQDIKDGKVVSIAEAIKELNEDNVTDNGV